MSCLIRKRNWGNVVRLPIINEDKMTCDFKNMRKSKEKLDEEHFRRKLRDDKRANINSITKPDCKI